jgi:hypothetical protein
LIKNLKTSLIAAAAASALALTPAFALASTQQAYTTTLQPAGPTMLLGNYYGSLKLTVSSDGIVQGWYQPEYGNYIAVSGSDQNGTYWLTFGNGGAFQIYAVKQSDGTLKGTATNVEPTAGPFPPTFAFVAKPA